MTDRLRESASAVLDCLDHYRRDEHARIEELRAALAEERKAPVSVDGKQEQEAEPVAWFDEEFDSAYTASDLDGWHVDGLVPLYPHPPRREWRGLTEQERNGVIRTVMGIQADQKGGLFRLARSIENALKERNA